MKTCYRILIILFACFNGYLVRSQTTSILPLNSQSDVIKLHKFAYWAASHHYRGTSSTINTALFAAYGEHSVYVAASGSNAGAIIYADTVPKLFSTLTTQNASTYDVTSNEHWAVNFKKGTKRIAIFRSKTGDGNSSISWQALYFQKLFDELLPEKSYYSISEDNFNAGTLSDSTELIVFPAIKADGSDYAKYVNQITASMPNFAQQIKAYLKRGGNIYTEGNGALFLESAGLINKGSIDYSHPITTTTNNYYDLTNSHTEYPLSLAAEYAGAQLYGTAIPAVSASNITSFYTTTNQNSPVIFAVSGNDIPFSHQVVANLGLTAAQSTGQNKKQIAYTLHSILGFFTSKLDVTRNVRNDLQGKIVAGANAVAYDIIDTFTVNIVLRNMSAKAIDNITTSERINPYFSFGKTLNGATASLSGNNLTFSGISLKAYETATISYTLITPAPDSKLHEAVDTYLAEENFISVSHNTTTYGDIQRLSRSSKQMAYADFLFNARIVADADVNWKNILYLDYQPFKVFLNMENKARTQAEQVVYTQYIPKDVPYYQSDQSINIPILRTPGGKFVTVMRGSNDQKNPEYDFDSDGKPDAWLDTASIYPKGYTIVEDSVYWANPWSHLKSGDKSKIVFEDIDGDGQVAQDNDNDGRVDVDEPGDKIRVWKLTWNIGTVAGYEYYEPYCSYELWLDPPKQVELSAGVAKVYDSLTTDLAGQYYPFAPSIDKADKNNKAWERWMETDNNGNVVWKNLVLQSANNYEGYAFIDTAQQHYKMRPGDKVLGRAPQPHNEFIAVVSMGGEEIDMTHWVPSRSLYSNINYKTIFGEEKQTPIRTTYTYYAPLPNPLQFEYLTDRVTITDTLGSVLTQLPHRGKAHLQFDIDASTEYSYYWIRGMGHDVDYNDYSEKAEGAAYEKLGDGVFGYFVYEIPKGMGGYKITLPRNQDGTFNVNEIVKVNGGSFQKWLDNPNTHNEIEVWENALSYQIYIPQILIPPALDDDNHDGKDDWFDDRGDRFSSKTGFLHDEFMLGRGEDYPKSSTTSHYDNLAGTVDSGWVAGADKTFGDDEFEALGKTHFTITAQYEGLGREGQLEISKGGTLVVEEIFGGSPWVIFSHALSSKSEGIDLSIKSSIHPSVVKVGTDTVYIKHTIEDRNEPHSFDINFDPYHASLGYKDANFTTLVGTKDPCNLMSPAIDMPAIIDPTKETESITLIPMAASLNRPELSGFPKKLSGTFVEVRVEVSNCSNDDWINTELQASLPAGTSLALSYVAYPRPLVPNDNIGGFQAGWRFNQPEGEVLVNLGSKIPLIQPTRRAYFVFLLQVDKSVAKGIYDVSFSISGQMRNYTGTNNGALQYIVPNARFCVAEKTSSGAIKNPEKLVLGQAQLSNIIVSTTPDFQSLGEAKWSLADITATDYAALKDTLTVTSNAISLKKIGAFPSNKNSKFFILQPGIVDSYNSDKAELKLTNQQVLRFKYATRDSSLTSDSLKVTPIGPKIRISHTLYSVNGKAVTSSVQYESDKSIAIATIVKLKNYGADISRNTSIKIQLNQFFQPIIDSLPSTAVFANNTLSLSFGDVAQGESYTQKLYFTLKSSIPKSVDISKLINKSDIEYTGTAITENFKITRDTAIIASLYDLEINSITYSQIDSANIHISATAFNKGLAAQDVWFRIYPVIGQGAHEFAIVEQKIAQFEAGQSLTIEKDYSLPTINKSLEMFTRIDDEDAIVETNEQNNTAKTGFILTNLQALNQVKPSCSVGPNPTNALLTFDYVLASTQNNMKIMLIDNNSSIVKQLTHCPSSIGSNKVILNVADLLPGVYFYQIQSDEAVLLSGKFVKQ